MRKFSFLFFLLSAHLWASAQVIFFQQAKLNEPMKELGFGVHALSLEEASSIKSMQIIDGTKVVFIEENTSVSFGQRFTTYLSTRPSLQLQEMPYKVLVLEYKGQQQVALFSEPDFGGSSRLMDPGSYQLDAGFRLSSLYIPSGFEVVISKEAFSGDAAPSNSKTFNKGLHSSVSSEWEMAPLYIRIERASMTSSPAPAKAEPEKVGIPSIDSKYLSYGLALGNALKGEGIQPLGVGDWQYQQFQHGRVYRSETKGCYALFGNIYQHYLQTMAGHTGKLGLPTSDVENSRNYRFALFEKGMILELLDSKDIKVIFF